MPIGEQMPAGYVPRRKPQTDPVWQTDSIHQQAPEILIGFVPVGRDLIAVEIMRGMSSEPISAQKPELGPAVAQNWHIDEALLYSETQSSWRGKGMHMVLQCRYLHSHSASLIVYSDSDRLERGGLVRRLMTFVESCQQVTFDLKAFAPAEPLDLLEAYGQQVKPFGQPALPIYFAERQAIMAMSEAQEKQEAEIVAEIDDSRVKPHLVHDGSDE
jgi:hypothetical protein